MPIAWHIDDPELLREAIRFTAAKTGFQPALVEKDYFASVVLDWLSARSPELAFKGGTALSKIHSGFFRLSEDLDFSIAPPDPPTRQSRSQAASGIKQRVSEIHRQLPGFKVVAPMRGSNQSLQYNGSVAHASLVGEGDDPVSIEVGLREPLLRAAEIAMAQTIVRNPLTDAPLVPPFPVRCLAREEAVAEKFRAAMCRAEVAIRDFFDVDHLVTTATIDPGDEELQGLIARKIDVPGTGPIDLGPNRIAALRSQVEGRLRPVLRPQEFEAFNLERAIETVAGVAARVGELQRGPGSTGARAISSS
jgi:predicted nucleotidyltransferase component of viral defense system